MGKLAPHFVFDVFPIIKPGGLQWKHLLVNGRVWTAWVLNRQESHPHRQGHCKPLYCTRPDKSEVQNGADHISLLQALMLGLIH